MERRNFVRGAGLAGVLAAGMAPAIVHAQATLRWRLFRARQRLKRELGMPASTRQATG